MAKPSGLGRQKEADSIFQVAGCRQGPHRTAQGTPQPPRPSCPAALDPATLSPGPLLTAVLMATRPSSRLTRGILHGSHISITPGWGERAPVRPGSCPSCVSCREHGGRAPPRLLCDYRSPNASATGNAVRKGSSEEEPGLQFLKIEV